MKKLIIIFLYLIGFGLLPYFCNAQIPITGCQPNGKFEYDDFEKLIKDIHDNEKIEVLPNFYSYIEDCKSSLDPKKCLEDKLLWFDIEHLIDRNNALPVTEIENGIEIISTLVCESDPGSEIIAESDNRHDPDEDLTFGENGDGSGLLLEGTPEVGFLGLWYYFELLVGQTTIGVLDEVGEEYVQRFKNKTGGKYFNTKLSNEARQSPEMRNFIKNFGIELNKELILRGGNFPTQKLYLRTIHPVWSGTYNLIHGLQILINDTEQTFIKKINYSFDPVTGDWEGQFWFNITDNFGLDKQDALKFQALDIGYGINVGHKGFPAWWRLQHQKAYVPFITDIRICATIKGKI